MLLHGAVMLEPVVYSVSKLTSLEEENPFLSKLKCHSIIILIYKALNIIMAIRIDTYMNSLLEKVPEMLRYDHIVAF